MVLYISPSILNFYLVPVVVGFGCFFPFINGLDYVFRPTLMHGRKEIQGRGGILTVLLSELHKLSFSLLHLIVSVSSLLSLWYIASQKEPPAPDRTCLC